MEKKGKKNLNNSKQVRALRGTILVLIASFILPVSLLFAAPADNKKDDTSLETELKFKAGDERGNELKALKAELLISKSDEKALGQLKKLLIKYKGTALEPSLQFRLAELYMRRAKTATFFEIHRDDQNVVHFTPTVTQSNSSKQSIKKAVDIYDSIERRFVNFKDMDLVLFNSAFARQIISDEKQAISRYKRVIDDFPSSPLVPDCHLAIGESYFNNKSFQAAFNEFQEMRKFPEARVFPYGLYKGAWALYNLHNTPDALKQLEEVVAYSKALQDENSARLDLSHEALDDMVVFFEDVKKPSEAVGYFREQAGDARAGDLVLKLGKLYQRHGRFANLVIVFTDLIGAVPQAAERPDMHHDLMEGYETAKNREKVIEQLETLSSLCAETSKWSLAQTQEARTACKTNLDETGRLYASKWHHDFLKNKEREKDSDLTLAKFSRRAYEALLNSPITISNEDKFRFAYAELLFQLKDYLAASKEYFKVAHLTTDSKLRHDGSYGALVAIEKSVGDKWPDKEEKEFNRLADDYLTLNPKGAYVTDIKFKKAFIAYDKGRFNEAAPQFREIALRYNGTERGRKAAHLYLDVLNIQKKYEALRDESIYFIQKLNLDQASRDEFDKIHEQAGFTVVQNLENLQKYPEAIKGYLAFVKERPSSVLADKAFYNAIRCANFQGDLTQAAYLIEGLLEKYPQTLYRNELAHNLIILYEAQAQLKLVGKTFSRLALWEPDHAASHLLNAADFKALSGEWTEAFQTYTLLAQKYPKTIDGKTALERLAAYAEKNHQIDKMTKLLEQIVDLQIQPQASLAAFKLAQYAYNDRNEEKAFKLAKRVIAQRNEKNVSNWALAQARLIQAKVLEKEFDQASVKARPERLSLVLQIKTSKLENTQKAYTDAIAFGDRPTAVEALIHLAKCYEKFSAALNTIQPPLDASEPDKKKFLSEIENMAVPIEEKNAETLQLALKQAKDLELHDGTVNQIQIELNRLSKRTETTQVPLDLSVPENVLPLVN